MLPRRYISRRKFHQRGNPKTHRRKKNLLRLQQPKRRKNNSYIRLKKGEKEAPGFQVASTCVRLPGIMQRVFRLAGAGCERREKIRTMQRVFRLAGAGCERREKIGTV